VADNKNFNKVSVIIVGAGPAGLATAITIKKQKPHLDVCVVEKGADAGNHNLSGAALEKEQLHQLLDSAAAGWKETEQAKEILARTIDNDNVYMFLLPKIKIPITPFIKIAKKLGLGLGQMVHAGDYLVSVSKLSKWLASIARQNGIEVLTGFSVEDILWENGKAAGVALKEQGLDKHGNKQPNYAAPEKIYADVVVLAEGCDGLVTEKFVEKAGLQRKDNQLYSLGIKEIVKVSDQQYKAFGDGTCVHSMGYPIWTPFIGPAMFGGSFMYAMGDNKIAVGVIVGLDFKYCDFNPQDALTHFKNTPFAQQYLSDGQAVEAGAKMIPEGGLNAIPRDRETGDIGKFNTVIVGDSAGFVNMLKIKGLHNAIESGMLAGKAIAKNMYNTSNIAADYTRLVDASNIYKEMYSARNFRQTFVKLGATFGMPFSIISNLLPQWKAEKDYQAMTSAKYRYKGNKEFDKDTFTAMASTEHREEQPSHLTILDPKICVDKCTAKFNRPCITFCPAGVYETVHDEVKPANPSNCLHCKTCQRKCPFDNIRWTVPEGTGGPRYKNM
jgi:electron-transferring-flavoprotein dehydrogenase